MIGSNIQRIIAGRKQGQQEIVTGICDYVPYELRSLSELRIAIIGDIKTAINFLLWNQFFTKTLLKECHHVLLFHPQQQSQDQNGAVFAKISGKVYRIQCVTDWNSEVRTFLNKSNTYPVQIILESFNQQGKTRKISIKLSNYALEKQSFNMILKTNSLESLGSTAKNTPKGKTKEQKKVLKGEQIWSNTKNITGVTGSYGSKTQRQPKFAKTSVKNLNNKQNSLKTQKKPHQKTSSTQSNLNSKKQIKHSQTKSRISIPRHLFPEEQSLPCEKYANHSAVLSKIITAKDQAIISLKQKLAVQESEYQTLIRQQDQSHQETIAEMSQNVKQILQKYETSQKEHINQGIYLKQRISVLETTLKRNQQTRQQYVVQMQQLTRNNYQLQKNLKITEQREAESKARYEQQVKTSLAAANQVSSQMRGWIEKANTYMQKYQKLVLSLKNVMPIQEPS